jgi:hypothetical protein
MQTSSKPLNQHEYSGAGCFTNSSKTYSVASISSDMTAPDYAAAGQGLLRCCFVTDVLLLLPIQCTCGSLADFDGKSGMRIS